MRNGWTPLRTNNIYLLRVATDSLRHINQHLRRFLYVHSIQERLAQLMSKPTHKATTVWRKQEKKALNARIPRWTPHQTNPNAPNPFLSETKPSRLTEEVSCMINISFCWSISYRLLLVVCFVVWIPLSCSFREWSRSPAGDEEFQLWLVT